MTDSAEPDTFGLDKGARLAAKRDAEANAARDVEPLDPPFPYHVLPFQPPDPD